jgi:hypothetical protein
VKLGFHKYKCFDIYGYDYIYKVRENNVLKVLFSALFRYLTLCFIIEYTFHFEEFLSIRCFLWFRGNNPEERSFQGWNSQLKDSYIYNTYTCLSHRGIKNACLSDNVLRPVYASM